MYIKPAQCLYIQLSAQTWKTMIKNFQKYFYNNQDKEGKYPLKTLCFKENGLSIFLGANNAR